MKQLKAYRICAVCFTISLFYLFVFSLGEIGRDLIDSNFRISQRAGENVRSGVGGMKDSVINLLDRGMTSALKDSGARAFLIDLYGIIVREIDLRILNHVQTDKIVRLENGLLCNVSEKSDLSVPTQVVVEFAMELRKRGIPFVFCLAPHKGHKTARGFTLDFTIILTKTLIKC